MLSNYLMQANTPVEAVIFDLDDTLISWESAEMDWFTYIMPTMQRAVDYFSQHGVKIEATAITNTFVRTLRHAWQQPPSKEDPSGVSLAGLIDATCNTLGINTDAIDLQALIGSLEGYPMPGVALYPDALSVLNTLRQRGYKIGLITNSFSPMRIRDYELAHYGIIDYFDARITSGDTGFEKPNPAIFWRMLGLLNTTPDKAIFIGDNPAHDIAGANRCGLTSVRIDPPHLNRPVETADAEADYTITALSNLLDVLSELETRVTN